MRKEGKIVVLPPVALTARLEAQRSQRKKRQREELIMSGTVEIRFRTYLGASREVLPVSSLFDVLEARQGVNWPFPGTAE